MISITTGNTTSSKRLSVPMHQLMGNPYPTNLKTTHFLCCLLKLSKTSLTQNKGCFDTGMKKLLTTTLSKNIHQSTGIYPPTKIKHSNKNVSSILLMRFFHQYNIWNEEVIMSNPINLI